MHAVPHACCPLGQLRVHAFPEQVSPDGQSAFAQHAPTGMQIDPQPKKPAAQITGVTH